MSSAKKKPQKLHITEFLRPDSTKSANWADDEVDDVAPLPSYLVTEPAQHLPSAPAVQPLPALPQRPPFKAFIGNVPHEVTSRDIHQLFSDQEVVDVHVITHRDTGNPRGVFVEFATQEGLAEALRRTGVLLMGRPLRIDLAEERPLDRSRGYQESYGRRDHDTRGSYGAYGDSRGYGNRSGDARSPRYDRAGPAEDYYGSRGGRSSYGSQEGDAHGAHRGGHSGGYSDRGDFGRHGSGGHGRDGDPSGYGDRFSRQGSRSFNRDGLQEDTEERWGNRGGFSRQTSLGGASSHSLEPRERPKLTLQPRSRPVGDAAEPPEPAPALTKKANPFGQAKPIDAEAKLRELEERDAKQRVEEAKRRAEEHAAAKTLQAAPLAMHAAAVSPHAPNGPAPLLGEDDRPGAAAPAGAGRGRGPLDAAHEPAPDRGGRHEQQHAPVGGRGPRDASHEPSGRGPRDASCEASGPGPRDLQHEASGRGPRETGHHEAPGRGRGQELSGRGHESSGRGHESSGRGRGRAGRGRGRGPEAVSEAQGLPSDHDRHIVSNGPGRGRGGRGRMSYGGRGPSKPHEVKGDFVEVAKPGVRSRELPPLEGAGGVQNLETEATEPPPTVNRFAALDLEDE